MADLYTYFFERGMKILNENGLFGIIVANKWMRARYGEPLRIWLKDKPIQQIIDFGDLRVFQQATTYPCIFITGQETGGYFWASEVKNLELADLSSYYKETRKKITRQILNPSGWQLKDDIETNLLHKISQNTITLGNYVNGKIFYGIKTGLNDAFVIDEETKNRLISEDPRSTEVIKPFLAGRDIKRYQQPVSDKYLILFPKGITNEQRCNKKASHWLSETYPAIARYLNPFSEVAQKRWDKGDYWWELRACDYYDSFKAPKIMLPDIAMKMQALYDIKGLYCSNTAYIIPVDDKFLLAILNSKLVQFFYSNITSKIRGGYLRFIRQYLERIPIPIFINTLDSSGYQKQIIEIVDNLQVLNEQLNSTTLKTHFQSIEQAVNHAEKRIDQLVYELYGLGEEEIRIIESA